MFAARARSKRAAALPTVNGSSTKQGASAASKKKSSGNSSGTGIYDKILFTGAFLLLVFTIFHRTKMSSSLNSTPKGSKAAMFHKNPSQVVKKLKDCEKDKGCRIFYHHIQKTGEVGASLGPFFNKGAPFQAGETCCFAYFIERFRADPQQYCHQRAAKFLEFEVMPVQFKEVVDTCLKESNITRIVGLSTYREPMQRVINTIFQHCNRGGCANDDDKCHAACKSCHLTEETAEFYGVFMGRSNTIYTDQLSLLTNYDNKNVQVVAVEDTEVNDMIAELRTSTGRNISFVVPDQMKDGECNFEASADMMTMMKPSLDGYKEILRLP